MKTNLFKPKSVKNDKITIEEEQLYSPLLLLFKRYGCLAVLLLFLIIAIMISILWFTIANLKSSDNDGYVDAELAFEYGDDNVNLSDMDSNSDWISKYANVYKKEGVIFVVRIFKVPGGIVTYYSDESSKFVRDDGSIVRISRLVDGGYGIDENGVINSKSKRKSITIVKKEELKSGTVIIYYSDGSAEITKDDKTILVRNSKRIEKDKDDFDLDEVLPSGVSYPDDEKKIKNYDIVYYTDGTIKIDDGNNVYIIRNSDDIIINNNSIIFPNHNEAHIINTKKLNDGTVIIYYSDGSALIETFYDTEIMVRKSGDIILDGDNSFWEILDGDIAFAVYTKKTPNGDEITYYDDGSAVIRYKDGTSKYVNENSNIKYDDKGNIVKIDEKPSSEKKVVNTPDGVIITYFDNGKCRIEDGDKDYIIDEDSVVIDSNGEIVDRSLDENNVNKYNIRDKEKNKDDDNKKDNDNSDNGVNGRIDEVDDNYYNFILDNTLDKSIKYKIVIEESSNYSKYGYTKILPAKYIKYDMSFDDKLFEGVKLNSNIWDYNGKTNYVLYEGDLNGNSKLDVMLNLYFDYADLDNSMQDHRFLGTVKMYVEEK